MPETTDLTFDPTDRPPCENCNHIYLRHRGWNNRQVPCDHPISIEGSPHGGTSEAICFCQNYEPKVDPKVEAKMENRPTPKHGFDAYLLTSDIEWPIKIFRQASHAISAYEKSVTDHNRASHNVHLYRVAVHVYEELEVVTKETYLRPKPTP